MYSKNLALPVNDDTRREVRFAFADRIIHSTVEINRTVTLTVPSGGTGVEILQALNLWFAKKYSALQTQVVSEGDFQIYAKRAETTWRSPRPGPMRIEVAVPETRGLPWMDQIQLLTRRGLSLPSPLEMAIALACYTCKTGGEDLLQGLWTLTNAPGVPLAAKKCRGLVLCGYVGDETPDYVVASGMHRALPTT